MEEPLTHSSPLRDLYLREEPRNSLEAHEYEHFEHVAGRLFASAELRYVSRGWRVWRAAIAASKSLDVAFHSVDRVMRRLLNAKLAQGWIRWRTNHAAAKDEIKRVQAGVALIGHMFANAQMREQARAFRQWDHTARIEAQRAAQCSRVGRWMARRLEARAWRAWRSHTAAQQESEARLSRAHEFLRGYFRRLTASVDEAAAARVRSAFGRWRVNAARSEQLARSAANARLQTRQTLSKVTACRRFVIRSLGGPRMRVVWRVACASCLLRLVAYLVYVRTANCSLGAVAYLPRERSQ